MLTKIQNVKCSIICIYTFKCTNVNAYLTDDESDVSSAHISVDTSSNLVGFRLLLIFIYRWHTFDLNFHLRCLYFHMPLAIQCLPLWDVINYTILLLLLHNQSYKSVSSSPLVSTICNRFLHTGVDVCNGKGWDSVPSACRLTVKIQWDHDLILINAQQPWKLLHMVCHIQWD